ncbi:uncharacterized protein TrAtP1_008845 [Trichoderma atroviride]|uniref:uncharacterized protein n=1 Tax=Hypocrea atroviridis TaxID=63577 RepID=UPI003319037C|nr:hypothetical protein TrAtP1_008845 [Trichoderma atroviride]
MTLLPRVQPVAVQALIVDLLQKPRCSSNFLASSLPRVEIVELDGFKLWLPDRRNDVCKPLPLADGALWPTCPSDSLPIASPVSLKATTNDHRDLFPWHGKYPE